MLKRHVSIVGENLCKQGYITDRLHTVSNPQLSSDFSSKYKRLLNKPTHCRKQGQSDKALFAGHSAARTLAPLVTSRNKNHYKQKVKIPQSIKKALCLLCPDNILSTYEEDYIDSLTHLKTTQHASYEPLLMVKPPIAVALRGAGRQPLWEK